MLVLQKYSLFGNTFKIPQPKQNESNNNTILNSEGAGFESRPESYYIEISLEFSHPLQKNTGMLF
jgi:hypothetical protein